MASGPWIGIPQTSVIEKSLNWFGPNRFRIAGVAEFGQRQTGAARFSESVVRPPRQATVPIQTLLLSVERIRDQH